MIGNEQLAKIENKMIITIVHNNVLIMRDFESSLRQIEDKIIETTEPIKYPHTAPPLPNNAIIKGIVIISIKNENIQNSKHPTTKKYLVGCLRAFSNIPVLL